MESWCVGHQKSSLKSDYRIAQVKGFNLFCFIFVLTNHVTGGIGILSWLTAIIVIIIIVIFLLQLCFLPRLFYVV